MRYVLSLLLFLGILLPSTLNAAPIDWREEDILPPVPEEWDGFLAVPAYDGEEEEEEAEVPPEVAAARPYYASPFGAVVDEEDVYSIEAIEAVYTRPEPDEGYAAVDLRTTVRISLLQNFDLENAARSLASSSSSKREAIAEFIPFVNLLADFNITDSQRNRTRRFERDDPEIEPEDVNRFRESETRTGSAGITASQNLPWGGQVSVSAEQQRTETTTRFFESLDPDNDDPAKIRDEIYEATLSLDYDQPLLRGAGWLVGTANLKRARLQLMREAIDYRLQRRDTVLDIIQRYYNVHRNALDIEVSRAELRERFSFIRETRIRHELGLIPESEISRAEIPFLQSKQQFVNRQQSYEAAIDGLLTEMGLPLRTNITLADVQGQLVDLRLADIPPLEEGLEEALNNRLELLRQEIDVELARISLVLAQNNVLPNLDFNAGWDGFRDAEENPQRGDIEARRVWDAGISLNVPLPNIDRREALYRSKLALENTLNNQADLERTIVSDVKAAYRNLQTTELSTQIQSRLVEQARRSLVLENARFAVGLNTSTDVRNAQDDLFNAEANYNQALLQLQTDIARVYRALGRPIY